MARHWHPKSQPDKSRWSVITTGNIAIRNKNYEFTYCPGDKGAVKCDKVEHKDVLAFAATFLSKLKKAGAYNKLEETANNLGFKLN